MQLNNDKEKIEFILSRTPKLLLDQYVSISKLVMAYGLNDKNDNKDKLSFINNAYNAINIINKIVAMASNKLNINNFQFLSDTEEYKTAVLKSKVDKMKNGIKHKSDVIKQHDEMSKEIEKLREKSKEIMDSYEEPISNDKLDKEVFECLNIKLLNDDN